ncbi:HNH endonuclease signature motif containing protein [Staphylococcus canis]|uniref:HNH endonuclease n=1 Tax=Staphylococcus canis TaxID=2724942 RepID=A0ABS0T7S0_9STAP|nr:HNH endonuclease signature motif containing protein [Staphylococcus canis]MBI5974813.1 HNH endonuclease [Staphylococcus canis]
MSADKTVSSIKKQQYEDYWKLTVEYTDIHKMRFRNTLEMIVNYIDNHPDLKIGYDKKFYKELQQLVASVYQKADLGSVRKSINQMVKLGFVKPFLTGYHSETRKFLKASSNEEREVIFSSVYYSSANFQSSVTKDNSHLKHINFFLKTLMYKRNKELNKEEIAALMSSDIQAYKNKGYMNEKELNEQIKFVNFNKFKERKYNQISYFLDFLKYVPGITVAKNKSVVYYTEDASIHLSNTIDVKRDPTLFRLMKEKIKQESINVYGRVQCYFTKKEQKGLVVSHIIRSEDALRNLDIETAYDYKNALLLDPNSDAYFDKYDLTFNNIGEPKFGKSVPQEFKEEKRDLVLDGIILEGRQEYLKKHKDKFLEKN